MSACVDMRVTTREAPSFALRVSFGAVLLRRVVLFVELVVAEVLVLLAEQGTDDGRGHGAGASLDHTAGRGRSHIVTQRRQVPWQASHRRELRSSWVWARSCRVLSSVGRLREDCKRL